MPPNERGPRHSGEFRSADVERPRGAFPGGNAGTMVLGAGSAYAYGPLRPVRRVSHAERLVDFGSPCVL